MFLINFFMDNFFGWYLSIIQSFCFIFQGGSSSNSGTPSRPQRQTKETEK